MAGATPIVCDAPRSVCGDSCVDLETNPAHCGGCARQCLGMEQCHQGECVCPPDALSVRAVDPQNGSVSVAQAKLITATFTCTFDPTLAHSANAHLHGHSSGYVPSQFLTPDPGDRLSLDPELRLGRSRNYFPGERLTAWLGPSLAGPYLWQFTAEVSRSSPGQFHAGGQSFFDVDTASVSALGDLDGDGDLDFLGGTKDGTVLLRNLGTGGFAQPEPLPVMRDLRYWYLDYALGDVDRDGDLDVATSGHLLRNDGSGQFSLGPELPGCMAMDDLDGDGDLDCVSNVGSGQGHVLMNDGTGAFTVSSDVPFGFECEIADLDADADLDVLCIAPVVEAGRVFLNDGRGAFTRTDQVLGEVGVRGLAIGDVDADGDIDAVLTTWFGAGRDAPNVLWLNDGKGAFRNSGTIGSDGGDVALADVDGDGDLDALFSRLSAYAHYGPFHPTPIYENDGKGHFVDGGRTLGDPAFHWFKLGDLDGDGDLDAFVFHQMGNGPNYGAAWFNRR